MAKLFLFILMRQPTGGEFYFPLIVELFKKPEIGSRKSAANENHLHTRFPRTAQIYQFHGALQITSNPSSIPVKILSSQRSSIISVTIGSFF